MSSVTRAPTMPISPLAAAEGASGGWEARVDLVFERDAARTVLAARKHHGPLRVQKALYPEGPEVCQAVIVHPPGGIVGGDSLAIGIDAGAGTHAQLTTPGAAKWYRSSGLRARSSTTLRLRPGALIEWLPQETMLFDGARASIALRVELALQSRFIGWDVTCLGRTASGERYTCGNLRQSFELFRDGALLFCERTAIDGGSPLLQSGAILKGAPVFGTLVAAGAAVTDDLLASCRSVSCNTGEGAVTRLPEVFVARYRGDSASTARLYFATLWRLLRPSIAGRDAVMPRIWNT
jgi:urease accessory protein